MEGFFKDAGHSPRARGCEKPDHPDIQTYLLDIEILAIFPPVSG